jgi:predicted peptidase
VADLIGFFTTFIIMKRLPVLLTTLFLIHTAGAQQGFEKYEKHLFVDKGDTLPYRLLLPQDYNPQKRYPLIVFLHGSGERGRDNEKQLVHGASLFLRDSIRKQYPAFVLFPQCPENNSWARLTVKYDSSGKRLFHFTPDSTATRPMQLLMLLTAQLQQQFCLNPQQLYAGGLSMGGMGVFDWANRQPGLFAAVLPICGGGNPTFAAKMTQPAWWVFHGDKDPVVAPQYSQEMVSALQKAGAKVRLSLYAGVGHDSWNNAFAEPDLLQWLFSQRKKIPVRPCKN